MTYFLLLVHSSMFVLLVNSSILLVRMSLIEPSSQSTHRTFIVTGRFLSIVEPNLLLLLKVLLNNVNRSYKWNSSPCRQ
jgi:hypothetical protein